METTNEATIIAAEPEMDPAAPASGDGAGDEAGDKSCAEAESANRATQSTTANVLNDAIAELSLRK
ncbi:uncharacterized protein DS421_8g247470 [Arachis hypogaea]|nr:uncharacterized protein DS421_8g247470 [Arachis hypogaea]